MHLKIKLASIILCAASGCGQVVFEETADSGDDGRVGDVAPRSDAGDDAPVDEDAGPFADAGNDAPGDASMDTGSAPMDAGPACPASGLRAWYRLDEADGPVLDSSGCREHGVAVGVERGAPGVAGASARWNNSGSIHVANFSMTAAEWPRYTFEAWISYDDSPLATIAAASNGMGGDPFNFSIYTGNEVSVSLPDPACTGMGAHPDRSGVVVPRSTWTHVAVSVDPTSGAIRYFVNGRQTGTGMRIAAFCESPDGLYLGTLGTSTGWTLNGQLDEIKLWNVERTEDEVCVDAGGVVSGAECDLSGALPGI